MPFHRFRIRTLMIAVAAVALSLGALIWLQRRAETFRIAAKYHRHEYRYQDSSWDQLDAKRLRGLSPSEESSLKAYRQLRDYHLSLWYRYDHAARRPWLPVPPDPPEPK